MKQIQSAERKLLPSSGTPTLLSVALWHFTGKHFLTTHQWHISKCRCDLLQFYCPHLSSFPKKTLAPRRKERRRRPLLWTTHNMLISSCTLNILSFSAWWDWPQTSCCIAHAHYVWWGGSVFCCKWNQSPPTLDTYASSHTFRYNLSSLKQHRQCTVHLTILVESHASLHVLVTCPLWCHKGHTN